MCANMSESLLINVPGAILMNVEGYIIHIANLALSKKKVIIYLHPGFSLTQEYCVIVAIFNQMTLQNKIHCVQVDAIS